MLALAMGRHLNRTGVAAIVLLTAIGACRSGSTAGSAPPSSSATPNAASDASTTSSAEADGASSIAAHADAAPRATLTQIGFICVPPLSGDFERCPKGAMAGDDALRDCLRREAESKPKKPTFRIGSAPSSMFSPTHWRCVGVPLDAKTHVTIDTLAGLDETVPSTCASHTIDMVGPNAYGAIFFRCSLRARGTDEILPSDSVANP